MDHITPRRSKVCGLGYIDFNNLMAGFGGGGGGSQLRKAE